MSRRFVLLRHECPAELEKPSHWDFMLEADGVLMTWELRQLPSSWSAALQQRAVSSPTTAPAIRLADHRLAYLDYEGRLSGERGSVRRVDTGTYHAKTTTPERLHLELHGSILGKSVLLLKREDAWLISCPTSD